LHCGGDGTNCKTIDGFFDERELTPGYHDVITLPVGATSIRIEEMRVTDDALGGCNFLSLGHNRRSNSQRDWSFLFERAISNGTLVERAADRRYSVQL
jgi:hypothetical protein